MRKAILREIVHAGSIRDGCKCQRLTKKIAFRHKQNFDEMHGGISMSWPDEERDDAEVISMRQSRRENAIVNYNPLN